MNFWSNLVGYQIVWFSSVIGAGHGLYWPGVLAALLFAISQLAWSQQRGIELRLVAIALICGMVIDGGIALSGTARYAANEITLLPGGAPLWILALWGAFALTLRHSMALVMRRPVIAMCFGAIGGPVAYLGAARGWQAITFIEPRWIPLLALSLGWAAALLLLSLLVARWSRTVDAHASVIVGSQA